MPKDAWGNEFVYYHPGVTGHTIEVISYGGDGEEGGEGFDADLTNYESKE